MDNFEQDPPIFVNEIGNKFWVDKNLTNWMTRPDAYGRVIKNGAVFYVKEPNGNVTRLAVIDNAPVYESPRMEDMAVWIDGYKVADLDVEYKND